MAVPRATGRAAPSDGGTARRVDIPPPFFEVGPKAYAFGPAILDLAREAEILSARHGVTVVLTPQYVDIPVIAREVPGILVFAQHMDALEPGRGVGSVLPEALKAAGAHGVLLNHAERPLPPDELARTMHRARQVALATLVCANDAAQAVEVAALGPTAIIVEEPGLIGAGSGGAAARASVAEVNAAIRAVDPAIRVLHAAGIGDARDVYDVIAAGAQGTGSSSAIFLADDPHAMLAAMVRAVREAWDTTHEGRGDER